MPKEKANARKPGTQSIERAALVLREVALRGRFGWGLSELAEHCDLDKATTYRILSCLVRERLLGQKGSDRRYCLGPLLYELGVSVPNFADFVSRCHERLTRIASKFDGNATLTIRSGFEGVYAARAGRAAVRGVSEVGSRRPLLATTAGMAIMLCLPEAETQAVVRRNVQQMTHLGEARIRAARKILLQSKERGVVVNEEQTNHGLSVFATAIAEKNRPPLGALSIGGPTSSFPPACAQEVLQTLKAEVRGILQETNGGPYFLDAR